MHVEAQPDGARVIAHRRTVAEIRYASEVPRRNRRTIVEPESTGRREDPDARTRE